MQILRRKIMADCTNLPTPPHPGLLSFTYQLVYELSWREQFLHCPEESMDAFKLSDEEKKVVRQLSVQMGQTYGESSAGIGFAAYLLQAIYQALEAPVTMDW
jgi:hypothetical protein